MVFPVTSVKRRYDPQKWRVITAAENINAVKGANILTLKRRGFTSCSESNRN